MSEGRWLLPDCWEWCEAGEIADIVGGATPPSGDPANFCTDGIPWLTPADLSGYDGAYIKRGRRDLSQKGLAKCAAQMMPAGAVLFTSRAPVGYCVIASNPITTNQGFKSLVLKNSISPEYVRHYMLSAKDYAESLASGSTFKELSGSRMAALKVPIAPLAEQRRIVARIEALRERSGRARAALEAIPALIDRYRKAILAAAFRGDLTADWREGKPHQEGAAELLGHLTHVKERRLHAENRKVRRPGRENGNPDQQELEQLPTGWIWAPVESIAMKVVDGVHHTPKYKEFGIPFLTVKNLTRSREIDLSISKFVSETDHQKFIARAKPEEGDILITKDGTLGVVKAIRTKQTFSIFVSLALIKMIDKRMTDYIELALQSPICQKQMVGVGSGLQHIHLVDLRRDLVPIAPPDEQSEIVARIRQAMGRLDELARVLAETVKRVGDLDRAVLTKAFRGELAAQDPDDEAASVLLDRVRAEREATVAASRRRGRPARQPTLV